MLTALAFLLGQLPVVVRFSTVALTPPEQLPLGGYTARRGKVSVPGGDTLFARTVDLQQGEFEIAVVSAEMLTIPESLEREVAKRLPAKVHLFLCATHTHCAPDSQMLNDRMRFPIPGIATFDAKWLTWYAERIAGAVIEARASMPVSASSLVLKRWVADANRGRRKGAVPQQTAEQVSLGKGKDLFLHYAAHPTFYDDKENQTRGDWPGGVASHGGYLLLNGAIGDVSPKAEGATPAERIRSFWKLMDAGRARAVGKVIWRVGGPPLAWESGPVKLASPQPHPTFAKAYGIPEVVAKALVRSFAPPGPVMTAWRWGGLAVVGVPGEPSAALGRRIEAAGKAAGFAQTMVVSHVNNWMGYILEPEDYDRGGYEATLNFYGREEGLRVVEAARGLLMELAKKTRPAPAPGDATGGQPKTGARKE